MNHRFWRVSVSLLPVIFILASEAELNSASSDRLLDQYGSIGWQNEKARLDNFAIQLMTDPSAVGYIFVHDGKNLCAGEAQARAIRAKRYIVEHRGVPWDRVIWRIDGFAEEFRTTLQPIPRGVPFEFPFFDYLKVSPEVHVTKNCRSRLSKIKRSKW